MRTDASLIFPCFLKAWTEINALTITDSSSLRLRKLACHQKQPLKTILVIKMANDPLQTSSHIVSLNHHHDKAKSSISHQHLGCITCLANNSFISASTELHFCQFIFVFFEFQQILTHFVSIFLYLSFLHPSVLPKAQQSNSLTHFQLPGRCTIC